MRDVAAAELAFDLAKLDLALARAREGLGDEKLSLEDVAMIAKCASHFVVTTTAAYHRAKGLGLLSYQEQELSDAR